MSHQLTWDSARRLGSEYAIDLHRTAHNSDNRMRSVTPTADTNGVGSHDPLSDVCALFPQVGDYIGQLCGIF